MFVCVVTFHIIFSYIHVLPFIVANPRYLFFILSSSPALHCLALCLHYLFYYLFTFWLLLSLVKINLLFCWAFSLFLKVNREHKQPINKTNVNMIQTNSLCAPLPLLVPNCKITFAAVSDDNPFFLAVMTSSPLLYFHFRPALSVLEKQHTGTKDSLSVSPYLLFPLNDSYAPAYQQYRDRLAVVHFIGNFKPWQWLRFADGAVFPRNTSSKDSIDLVQQWWNVFDNFVGGKVCLFFLYFTLKYASDDGGR